MHEAPIARKIFAAMNFLPVATAPGGVRNRCHRGLRAGQRHCLRYSEVRYGDVRRAGGTDKHIGPMGRSQRECILILRFMVHDGRPAKTWYWGPEVILWASRSSSLKAG